MEIKNQQQSSFKNKGKEIQRILLTNFINDINNEVDDNEIEDKNKFVLKTLIYNLKEIDDDNVIIKDNKIEKIKGIDISDNKLLIIDKNNLYKNKKNKKNNKLFNFI